MHANTIAKLGLPPTASDAQIAAALHSPTAGRPAAAWNTEVNERMQSKGVNWQTAWADCQRLEPKLYAAYESDCGSRNRQAVAGKSADANALLRGETTLNSSRTVPDALGRTSNDGQKLQRSVFPPAPGTPAW